MFLISSITTYKFYVVISMLEMIRESVDIENIKEKISIDFLTV